MVQIPILRPRIKTNMLELQLNPTTQGILLHTLPDHLSGFLE